jgi:hypothetical protein
MDQALTRPLLVPARLRHALAPAVLHPAGAIAAVPAAVVAAALDQIAPATIAARLALDPPLRLPHFVAPAAIPAPGALGALAVTRAAVRTFGALAGAAAITAMAAALGAFDFAAAAAPAAAVAIALGEAGCSDRQSERARRQQKDTHVTPLNLRQERQAG